MGSGVVSLCSVFLLCLLNKLVDGQSPSPVATPTASPTDEPEDPLPSNLSLIIGLPVGIGLALILVGVCILWLTCSAYCENKDQPKTASTNLAMSNRSASQPVRSFNSSSGVSDSRAFEPTPSGDQSTPKLPPKKVPPPTDSSIITPPPIGHPDEGLPPTDGSSTTPTPTNKRDEIPSSPDTANIAPHPIDQSDEAPPPPTDEDPPHHELSNQSSSVHPHDHGSSFDVAYQHHSTASGQQFNVMIQQ